MNTEAGSEAEKGRMMSATPRMIIFIFVRIASVWQW